MDKRCFVVPPQLGMHSSQSLERVDEPREDEKPPVELVGKEILVWELVAGNQR